MSEPILLYSEFDLIIDTDHESHQFYNELCAYCTGFIDGNDTARDYSDLFYLDMNIEDDESPRGRVSEEKNPFFNCLRFIDDGQTDTPFALMANKRWGAVYTDDSDEQTYAVLTEENCEKYSDVAIFSVAIMFDLEPNKKQIQIIKERAIKFFESVWPKLSKDKVNVEGFRLVTRTHYGQETII